MAIVTDKKPFEFPKQPSEKEIIGVDFSRRIPPGVSIIDIDGPPEVGYSVTVNTTETGPSGAAGAGDSNPLTVSYLSVSRKVLSCMVSAGTDQFVYRCTFVVTLSDGQVKEEDVFVRVNEV